MPEDGVIGFRFFTSANGRSIVNEAAEAAAYDRLDNEIANYMAFDHLQTAIDAVQTAAERHDRQDPVWDDNVPPDLTDGFDFLL